MILVKIALKTQKIKVFLQILVFFEIPGNPGDSGFLGYPRIIPSCIPDINDDVCREKIDDAF